MSGQDHRLRVQDGNELLLDQVSKNIRANLTVCNQARDLAPVLGEKLQVFQSRELMYSRLPSLSLLHLKLERKALVIVNVNDCDCQ
jgi:hypothetical protein